MKKVELNEIIGPERYEQVRDEFRKRIINVKKERRVGVGDAISFVFENHDTVLFQIQEMLRAERITDLDKIRFEVETYNELLAENGDLSATMLIEITGQEKIRPQLEKLVGIETAVSLHIGAACTIPAKFEAGRSTEDNVSAVQYVQFPLSLEARAAFQDHTHDVKIVIEHPYYQAQTSLSVVTRRALAADW